METMWSFYIPPLSQKWRSMKHWWRPWDHSTYLHSKSKVEECEGLMEIMWSFYIPPLKVKSGGVWRTGGDHRIILHTSTRKSKVKDWWRPWDPSTYLHSMSKVEECKGFYGDYVIILHTSTQSQKWRSVKDWWRSCDQSTYLNSMSKVEECKGFDGDYVTWPFYIPPFKVKSEGVWRTGGDHGIILHTSIQSQKWRSVKDLMEIMWSFYIPPLKCQSWWV